MHNPLVSIVIPVYNGANFMREAIDSALAQTYPHVEVLVVNDGSTDDTEAIAISYGDRIRYFKKENGGVSTALNLGIERMTGDYFAWLSHDDGYYPWAVEDWINALRADGDMAKVAFSRNDTLDHASGIKTPRVLENTYPKERLETSVYPVLKTVFSCCAMLVHRSHFERIGRFDESLPWSQDYDFAFRLLRGQRSCYVERSTGFVRIHPAQLERAGSDFSAANGRMVYGFMEALELLELEEMQYPPQQFYFDTAAHLWSYRNRELFEKAAARLKQFLPFGELSDALERKLRGEGIDRICIFCAGIWGRRALLNLRARGVTVDCFSDNNPAKWGTEILGLPCISPEHLEKSSTLLLVMTEVSYTVAGQLRGRGFKHIMTKPELAILLEQYPPTVWPEDLEEMI